MTTLEDWLDLDMIRVLWPGIDPMDCSHRRNMALLEKGVNRGKTRDIVKESKEAFGQLQKDLLEGRI